MVDIVHVGDIGTVIYLPTFSGNTPLDDSLELFTLRTAWLMRPGIAPLIEITDIPTEVDPLDTILKLKLVTGTDTGLALTGIGNFALLDADVGDWLCTIALAHATGYWSSAPFRLFTLQRTLPAPTPVLLSAAVDPVTFRGRRAWNAAFAGEFTPALAPVGAAGQGARTVRP